MESQYNNNDFERFLKENADQYRMFPSENVWKGIHNNLHTRRRWHGIGLALLLLTTGTVSFLMLTHSNKKTELITATRPAKVKKQAPAPVAAVITPLKPVVKTPIASPGNQQKNYFMATDDWEYTSISNRNNQVTTGADRLAESGSLRNNNATAITNPVNHLPRNPGSIIARTNRPEPELINNSSASANGILNLVSNSDLLVTTEGPAENSTDKTETFVPVQRDEYPLTIESVINTYSATKRKRKAQWQLFITPNVTYRKLNENKQFISSARSNMSSPVSSTNIADLNNLVLHRPDIGLQLGVSVALPLSRKLSFLTGLQFNVSKYDIRAYSFTSEIATIALSNDYGGTSTMSTVSNYRVVGLNGANKANWLRNFYYSASMPVGLQYKFLKVGNTYAGISATTQPTYVLGNRAWVVSTDYKNYVEVPSLTRRWNVNAAMEAFAGFNVGKSAWRIGPQVRYQTMSSYKKQYPVKEHLFDYGLKLGILLNQ